MMENIYEVNGSSYRLKLPYYDNGERKFYSESFSFKKYGNKKNALEAAKRRRDDMRVKLRSFILPKMSQKQYTMEEIFDLKEKLIPRDEDTNSKHRLWLYKYMITDKFFNDITASDIQESLNKMVSDCSQDTINRIVSLWRACYKAAIMADINIRDQSVRIEVPKSKYVRNRRSVVSDMSVDDIINMIENYHGNDRDKDILIKSIKLMKILGTRPGETFALKREDIDIINKIVHIRRWMNGAGDIKPTKTLESYRSIPFSDKYVDLMIDITSDSKDFLFTRDNGSLMCSNVASILLRNITGGRFRCYMLRHMLATNLVNNRVDLKTAQKILGHKSPSQTLNYAEPNDELMREALENI